MYFDEAAGQEELISYIEIRALSTLEMFIGTKRSMFSVADREI